ncbi:hypothetical protein VKT23_016902 [Stygiomarasmius scandens]|uniref:Uncharacterized protein n=1 Tax=Marasmiellus scandens TaxID=2682957 RepID=A0ABR1IVZ8_9AGAR
MVAFLFDSSPNAEPIADSSPGSGGPTATLILFAVSSPSFGSRIIFPSSALDPGAVPGLYASCFTVFHAQHWPSVRIPSVSESFTAERLPWHWKKYFP